ncbi:MAG TPA: hypothetical protein DCM25_10185 [Rhodobacteraceae bacterium]|nr:hypothetical protein [Paracoccaceae bacterium]
MDRTKSEIWRNIGEKGIPPSDADDWADKPDKLSLLSENPLVS